MTLQELMQMPRIDGSLQPSLAVILWRHCQNEFEDVEQSNVAADKHLSALVGYAVHFFTEDGE